MVEGSLGWRAGGVETLSGPLTSHIHAPHYPDGRSKRSEANGGGGGGGGHGGVGGGGVS